MIPVEPVEPVFPNEILRLILLEFGVSDGRVLYQCLFVSRQVYHLVIPILYEHIDLETKRSSAFTNITSAALNVSHPTGGLRRPTLLQFAFQSNPTLAARTRELSGCFPDRDAWRTEEQTPDLVFPLLTPLVNLQRLSLTLSTEHNVLKSIPSTALTHLSLWGMPNCEHLRQFLERQPFLHFFELAMSSDIADMPRFSPNALLNLKVFNIPYGTWINLLLIRPVAHIVLPEGIREHYPTNAFLNIKSLEVSVSNITFSRVAPYLPKLELLCGKIGIEDWKLLQSKVIRYIRLKSGYASPPEMARLLFEVFPSLNLIDFPTVPHNMQERFIRHAPSPTKVVIPTQKRWELWWESTQDAIDDADRFVQNFAPATT